MKEEIIEAVKNADADKIQELLAIEPSLIYTVTSAGISLILLACYYRNPEILKQLLGYQPDLSHRAWPRESAWRPARTPAPVRKRRDAPLDAGIA